MIVERRKFFTLLGAGAAVVVAGQTLASCSKNVASPYGAPQNVDFTLDLTNSTYTGLKSIGGSAYNSGIIIAHTSADTMVAVSDVCTHQGCTVQFNGSNGFICPCHGSTFASNGTVTRGPASAPLAKYNTTLSGNSLRVYS